MADATAEDEERATPPLSPIFTSPFFLSSAHQSDLNDVHYGAADRRNYNGGRREGLGLIIAQGTPTMQCALM